MSATAIIPARTMGNFIGDEPPARPRSPVEHDTCPKCGERKRADAELCRDCHQRRRRAMWADVNVPVMLERHRRFEFALDVGYAVQELMARAQRDDLPTYEQMAAERPNEYMRVWCKRQGIEAGDRGVA